MRKQNHRDRFKARFAKRFFVRFHMSMILMGTFSAGMACNWMLLELLGVGMPLVRIPLSILFAYSVFFMLVRLWLSYVCSSKGRDAPPALAEAAGLTAAIASSSGGIEEEKKEEKKKTKKSRGSSSHLDSGSLDLRGFPSSSSSSSASSWGGEGGKFSGGGASGSWGKATPTSGGGSSKGGGGFDLDLKEGAVVLVFLAVALGWIIAGIYLVYSAPMILGELAVEAALTSGLIRSAQRMDQEGWFGSVLRTTYIPFGIALVLGVVLGGTVEYVCPNASTIYQAAFECPDPQIEN